MSAHVIFLSFGPAGRRQKLPIHSVTHLSGVKDVLRSQGYKFVGEHETAESIRLNPGEFAYVNNLK